MRKILSQLKHRIWTDTKGAASIETVIMVPVLLSMLFLTVDASMTFAYHTQIVRTVQDANRQLSVGRLTTETEVVELIAARLASVAPNARISADIDGGTITSQVVFPLSDVLTFGAMTKMDKYTLSVQAENYIEY